MDDSDALYGSGVIPALAEDRAAEAATAAQRHTGLRPSAPPQQCRQTKQYQQPRGGRLGGQHADLGQLVEDRVGVDVGAECGGVDLVGHVAVGVSLVPVGRDVV